MNEDKFGELINQLKKRNSLLFTIEVGSSLSYLLKTDELGFVADVNRLRNDLTREWGMSLPPFLIRENQDMDSESYSFTLFDRELVRRTIPPRKTLIITTKERLQKIPGIVESDPIYSQPCIWMEPKDSLIYSATEPFAADTKQVIVEHLEATLRAYANDLVTQEVIREKLDVLETIEPAVVKESLKKLAFPKLVQIMKTLIPEGIPLTQISGVLKNISRFEETGKDPDTLSENLRNSLKDNIHNFAFGERLMFFVVPDSLIQMWLYRKAGRGFQVPDNDPVARMLVDELTHLYLSFHGKDFKLGVICSAPVRLILRRVLQKQLPNVVVLKPDEIDADRNIKVIKKIKGKGLKLWMNWFWFWVTAPMKEKRNIRTHLKYLFDYIKRSQKKALEIVQKIEPDSASEKPPYYIDRITSPPGQNLPAVRSLTKLQRAASLLIKSDDQFLRQVLGNLEYNQIISLAVEMANLPADFFELDFFGDGDEPALFHSVNRVDRICALIKDSVKDGEFRMNLSALQKLAIFLSSFSPKTAERMYKQILTDMSGGELEKLMHAANDKQVISLYETRNWVVEDFMWYIKGSIYPGLLYSREHWSNELRRIALKNPRKMTAVLKELWLFKGPIIDKFNRFSYQRPEHASFWLRKYIASTYENPVQLRQAEKALILIQNLPAELKEQVFSNLPSVWKRIIQNLPSDLYWKDPEKYGVVLTQFLSYYYSRHEQERHSKPNLN